MTNEEKKLPDDSSTGLPWPGTWRGVYVVVAAVFVLWVALLTWLSVSFP